MGSTGSCSQRCPSPTTLLSRRCAGKGHPIPRACHRHHHCHHHHCTAPVIIITTAQRLSSSSPLHSACHHHHHCTAPVITITTAQRLSSEARWHFSCSHLSPATLPHRRYPFAFHFLTLMFSYSRPAPSSASNISYQPLFIHFPSDPTVPSRSPTQLPLCPLLPHFAAHPKSFFFTGQRRPVASSQA